MFMIYFVDGQGLFLLALLLTITTFLEDDMQVQKVPFFSITANLAVTIDTVARIIYSGDAGRVEGELFKRVVDYFGFNDGPKDKKGNSFLDDLGTGFPQAEKGRIAVDLLFKLGEELDLVKTLGPVFVTLVVNRLLELSGRDVSYFSKKARKFSKHGSCKVFLRKSDVFAKSFLQEVHHVRLGLE